MSLRVSYRQRFLTPNGLLLGLAFVAAFPGVAWAILAGSCRVYGLPEVACNVVNQFWMECTNGEYCRRNRPVCTPEINICSRDGIQRLYVRTSSLAQLGNCIEYPYRYCTWCGGGCAFICAEEILADGINYATGEYIAKEHSLCLETHWADPGRCRS